MLEHYPRGVIDYEIVSEEKHGCRSRKTAVPMLS
jgi:hypothetical protein